MPFKITFSFTLQLSELVKAEVNSFIILHRYHKAGFLLCTWTRDREKSDSTKWLSILQYWRKKKTTSLLEILDSTSLAVLGNIDCFVHVCHGVEQVHCFWPDVDSSLQTSGCTLLLVFSLPIYWQIFPLCPACYNGHRLSLGDIFALDATVCNDQSCKQIWNFTSLFVKKDRYYIKYLWESYPSS